MSEPFIVITGGGSGIGRAVALLLASSQVPVAVVDKDEAAAAEVAASAREAGAPAATARPCDVTDESQLNQAVDIAVGENDAPPRGLVAAAGLDISGRVHRLDSADWRRVLEVNLTGSFLAAQAVLRHLVATGTPGSLVLCSSPAAQVAFAAGGANAYAASKGGVSALVRTLAVDYAAYGIRANAIVPGATETPLMWTGTPEAERERLRTAIRSEIPLGRLADPEEPARAAAWLLGPEASYVTGSHLVCDGGVLAKGSISF
ncbi:SDR family NAD(P)-dependent oxidoreductase [Salinifilum ghardaiensis]